MDSNRRYSEDEVGEILRRATDAPGAGEHSPAGQEGLTLAEIQDIGLEVGIDSGQIASAAKALDRREPTRAPERKFLGTTIGVGRTVYLDRPLTDAEWHRLVLDLRETFDAKGKIREEGSFRQWTNGNLQALLEPTDSGERLRLRTVKGDAQPLMGVGLGMIMLAPFLLVVASLMGGFDDPDRLGTALAWALLGAVTLAFQRFRLPRWAATRERQMEGIVARLTAGVEDSAGSEEDED